MKSTSEVGHAKNVANLNDLISFADSYGAAYNPTKASLKLAALKQLAIEAQTDLTNVINKGVAYNNAVNVRGEAFYTLPAFATRVMNSLKATDASPELIKDAQSFNRKLQGGRAKPKPPVDPNATPPASNSTSQQSFDQKVQHFEGLIAVADSEESYDPGEDDLKVAGMSARLADYIAKNKAVDTAFADLSNARLSRDANLYKTSVGLVDVAKAVKAYIKSVYGAKSPEYAQVSPIRFKLISK
ncbi:hypothetical protein EMGBS15_04610 [Filimonas sp.]|nr:hypothetical protein EMGBS15_04610 [Filimonas sp.]